MPQYGHCQTFKLPCGEFELSADPEKDGHSVLRTYKESDNYGYILEVDLIYPAHFQNTLAPYETVLEHSDLSPESQEMLAETDSRGTSYRAKKLVNDFKPRLKYLTHISNLQVCSLKLRL